MWRRFTIALRRLVAKTLGVPAGRLAEVATVQYAKVAEYQLRGVVHFHALIRLDGPKTRDGFASAPAAVDAALLARLVEEAARTVRLTVPGVDGPAGDDPPRVLAFGRQFDGRPVRTSRRTDDPDRALTPGQVADYLAKYATKSAADSARLRTEVGLSSDPSPDDSPAGPEHDRHPHRGHRSWLAVLGRGHSV